MTVTFDGAAREEDGIVIVTVTEPAPQLRQPYLDLVRTSIEQYTEWIAANGYLLKKCNHDYIKRAMVAQFMGEVRGEQDGEVQHPGQGGADVRHPDTGSD